jgi:hypothetical protein
MGGTTGWNLSDRYVLRSLFSEQPWKRIGETEGHHGIEGDARGFEVV